MAAALMTAEPTMTSDDKVKILLVDDNTENLVALEATLESLGQNLVKATSGLEALRHVLDHDFAAILLDVRMPDMDGFETATLIRNRKRSRNTPILFLTGYKDEEHLFRGYDLGAVDFLFKPIVPEILQSKVAVFVELSRNSILLKRQADELQRAEAGLRAVLEAAPEAMIIFDGAGRIQSVNPETERLFGYPRNQMLGESIDLLSPEWSTVEKGRLNEIICHTEAGTLFPAEVSLNPIAGSAAGMTVSVIRDITERRKAQEQSRLVTLDLERQVADRTQELRIDIAERKRAELALRESEQRLRIAIEAAQLGLWSVDVTGASMRLSPLTCQLFGLNESKAQISLDEWKELVHPDDRAQACGEMEKACSSSASYESQYRVLRPDGAVRWIFARGQLFAGDDESPLRVVGIAQDLTGRKLAEEADRHRHKLESLGILAGGIAHDFNNLLTGILGNASLLLEDAREGSPEHEILTELVSASQRAAQLTSQMLAYSGRGRFIVQPTALPDEIRDITVLIRSSIPRHVNLHLALDGSTPMVQADKSQIHQLVMNLVINAAEAIRPEGGSVRVATYLITLRRETPGFYPAETLSPGQYAVIEVQDDGHGMSEATRQSIFDPFFTTKFTGRGLGLAAALGIVRGHRGGIAVESAVGLGTTFRVYLPAFGATTESNLGGGAEREELEGSGTVLVVDDEPAVRSVARNSLRQYGYRVLEAENGSLGLGVFRENMEDVAVVILDMAMPGMSGGEVLRAMRALAPDVRVIASSGYSENEATEKFGDGLAGFLQKPYTVRQLAAKVAGALR